MESILKECGPIVCWRRSRDQKGRTVLFGLVEFREVRGIIRVMKILNDNVFKGRKIEVLMHSHPKKLVGSQFISK